MLNYHIMFWTFTLFCMFGFNLLNISSILSEQITQNNRLNAIESEQTTQNTDINNIEAEQIT